ncbi:MAG: condensation domain-containing protein [Candidatus Hodarchaeota archaeon]
MSETIELKRNKRKVSPLERMFTRSPYAIVTMVARIKGNISENMLKDAVVKLQQRHQNLRIRIKDDEDHIPWFTSEGVKEIPIEIITRESDEHWKAVFHEVCKVPFDFEERPPIRFILVQSTQISELIILCHHIICDGMSLAYLTRDLMVHLGDPSQEVEELPAPVPIDRGNLPKEVSINPIVKFFIDRMNKKWMKNPIFFDSEDYKNLNEAYWKKYKHEMSSVELSEAQTSTLVDRCRKEGVTVNTALTTAFVGAQYLIRGDNSNHSSLIIAGNLRDRLPSPAGEAMGYFAGGVSLKYKYNEKMSFWENARILHQKVQPLYTNKNLFKEPLNWCYLEPAIMESISFKLLGGLVPSGSPRYEKLSTFSKQNDVVSSVLKRGNIGSLDKPSLGTAVTNLTRLDFPRMYGSLEVDRLIMNPGVAFPISTVNFNLGAVTCAGKLSLLIEYTEEIINPETIEKIKEQALEFLLK